MAATPAVPAAAGVALILLLGTACGPTDYERAEKQRRDCVDSGKVAVYADPTDDNTMMIACVSVESVDDVYDSYTVAVSDD